jgi:hypothetical protein
MDAQGFVDVYDKNGKRQVERRRNQLRDLQKEVVALLPQENISFEETLYPVLSQQKSW